MVRFLVEQWNLWVDQGVVWQKSVLKEQVYYMYTVMATEKNKKRFVPSP